jgi:hypothetical protein
MKNNLPAYQELEDTRRQWIEQSLLDSSLSNACEVAEYYGEPIEVRYWNGVFFKLEKEGVEITTYRLTGHYSPALERAFEKTHIAIWDKGLLFVRLNLEEPTMQPQEMDVVVPGRWQGIVRDLIGKLRKEKAEKEERRDLAKRTELAKLLHII